MFTIIKQHKVSTFVNRSFVNIKQHKIVQTRNGNPSTMVLRIYYVVLFTFTWKKLINVAQNKEKFTSHFRH